MALDVDRRRVLAYRLAVHQLVEREETAPSVLAVMDLGIQDTPHGSAALAVSARTSVPLGTLQDAEPAEPGAGPSVVRPALVLAWSVRGAPHLHRSTDLEALAEALWPLSDADATARISSGQIKEGARLGLAAFTATAEALRQVVTEPMAKGEVSRGVSARVPESLTFWCAACGAQHIAGGLFQHAGLAGGVRLVPGASPTTLAPIPGWPGVPRRAAGASALVTTYLRLLGPATPGEAAAYLGTRQTAVRPAWPEGLAEIRVEGRRTWLPGDALAALRAAPDPQGVRLLPPSDPFLQARDRDVLVPDRARHREVWRALANPGAVLADGEIAGVWRARAAGRRRVDVAVVPFAALPPRVRRGIEDEASRVAATRGASDVRVRFDG